MNRTEQNRTEQNRTEQNRTEQNAILANKKRFLRNIGLVGFALASSLSLEKTPNQNKRGFSIVEILSATVLISILSVFSVTQYNRSKTKSLTKEAKVQLGHLLRMEKMYFIEHNTFTFALEGNIFPKGQLLYNVGFGSNAGDAKVNPCMYGTSGVLTTAFKNNYYELCGKTKNDGRKECWFKNKEGNTPPEGVPYTGLNAMRYYIPNANCGGHLSEPQVPKPAIKFSPADFDIYCDSSTYKLKPQFRSYPENENRYYIRFIAYAVGDILDPKNFSSSPDDLDAWRINGTGFLEHCNNPFNDEHDSVFKCDRNHPMKNTENDSNNYCHGVTPGLI